jgi:C-terminal processing protease CtpA/Prc
MTKVENIKKEIEEKRLAGLDRKRKELERKKDIVEKKLGFRIDVVNDQLMIIFVSVNGGAEAAGFKQNDQIVRINNRPVKGESVEKIIEYLAKGENGSYSFLAQRQVELTRKKINYQKHTFVGVGIFLDVEGNDLIVSGVIEGEPAYLAGLKPGDKVISINGKSTAGFSINDAAELIGGEDLSAATIVVQRSVKIERK